MTKTAWQKVLKLPAERGAQEGLSREENGLYRSRCGSPSCPGAARLCRSQESVPHASVAPEASSQRGQRA